MNIRKATYKDAPSIKLLLETLGYNSTVSLLVDQIEMAFGVNNNEIYICEINNEILGFASVHFFPQLAFDGDLAFISYLAEDNSKNKAVAKTLEEHINLQARKRGCDRIQVHCHDWRTAEHQFYLDQGYQLYPNFYTKRLAYGE
jgi:N-acetylglutamate synthase-like GNAT family acetyltransferase